MSHAAVTHRVGWLNSRRLRTHGLIVAVILWSVYAWDMSPPGLLDHYGLLKGSDFLHFYTLGFLAAHHNGALLYDGVAQEQLVRVLVPQSPPARFVPLYGPQVSILLAPLGCLPYGRAVLLWILCNAVVYFLCCYLVWRHCEHLVDHPGTVALLAIAFPGLFHLLTFGQSSGLALVAFTLAFLAYSARRYTLAGCACGLLALKPQLGLAAAVLFILSLEWKVVLGALCSIAAQAAIAWAYYGSGVLEAYLHRLLELPHVPRWLLEPKLYQLFSFRGFWSLLVPWPLWAFLLYVASSLIVLFLAAKIWLGPFSWNLRFSILLMTSVLIAPHLLVYDLVILAPAFLLLADWLLSARSSLAQFAGARYFQTLATLLYFSYLLSIAEDLTQWTRFQLETLTLFALMWMVVRTAPRLDLANADDEVPRSCSFLSAK
ncbi:MAG TPA: glycosyltransferase family 87 protein [Terriglobales bacterium]|nr:glycosyltransferase family 87 protein [Terriglobales bacterium]